MTDEFLERPILNSPYAYPARKEEAPSMSDDILTLQEVARLLKVANKTAYTIAQKGSFPHSRFGAVAV